MFTAGGSEQTQRFVSVRLPAGRVILEPVSSLWTGAASRMSGALERADGTPARVLVVDDEPSLVDLLGRVLRSEGWEVETADPVRPRSAPPVRSARTPWSSTSCCPTSMGSAVLRRLRADNPQVSVLFLTARDSVEDRIAGITAGGDDYVTKPFSLEEVIARLRGVLRRAGMTYGASVSLLSVGDLSVDEDAHEVFRAGDRIELTATEFELLRYLMRNPRRVLSKAQILDRVWDYDFGGQAHVVELYISYLRKKIDVGREPMIHTVRGAGYVLRPAT